MAAAESISLADLARTLAGLRGTVPSFAPLLSRYKVLLVSKAKECFDAGKAPDGTPWQALKRPRDRKRDRRAKGGSGQKPLRDTDVLMLSVTAQGQGHVERQTPTSLELGTNLDRAAPHQYGLTRQVPERKRSRPWVFKAADGKAVFTRKIRAHTVTLPARPFLGVGPATADLMGKMAAEFAVGELMRRSVRTG